MPSITWRPSCVVKIMPSAPVKTRGSLRKARFGVKGSQWLSMLKSLYAMGTPGTNRHSAPSARPRNGRGRRAPATMAAMSDAYILTLSCPDRPGIVHAVSGFLLERGGNIEEAAQYNDHGTGLFFMRVRFACGQLTQDDLRAHLKQFGDGYQMDWKLHAARQPMKTVIFVSKEGHCLNDLLFRVKSGLLPLDVRAIVSNHREFYQLAAS